jgi:hypothetical protein
MAKPLLFIAGWPASGKSHFGRWLAATHGYVHLDADQDTSLYTGELGREWDRWLRDCDATRLSRALRQWPQPVAVELGFPVEYLSAVAALKRAGFTLWWFDADPAAARAAFARRHPLLVWTFDRQAKAIVRNWPAIAALFAPNVVTTLDASGAHRPAEEIHRAMAGRAAGCP